MPFLIDGHNVIAALPDIDLNDPHDEAKLVLKLRAWSGRERRKVFVVFDGGIPGGYSRELSTYNVKVTFAARRHTIADRIIMQRLSKLRDTPNWTVVSSDYEILNYAVSLGAHVMTAQDFAEKIEHSWKQEQEKPEVIPASEVKEWLKIFGEVDVVESTPRIKVNPPAPKVPSSPEKPTYSQVRTTRSLGQQVGMAEQETSSQQRSPESSKPEYPEDDEVTAWLEIFQDVPDTPAPAKPQSVQSTSKRRHRQRETLTVKKEGSESLSAEEVSAWMDLFSKGPSAKRPSSTNPPAPRKARRSARLERQKKRQAPGGQPEGEGLAPDELEEWYNMFGKS